MSTPVRGFCCTTALSHGALPAAPAASACRVITSTAPSTRLATPWWRQFQGTDSRTSAGGLSPQKSRLRRADAFLVGPRPWSLRMRGTQGVGLLPTAGSTAPTMPSREDGTVWGQRQSRRFSHDRRLCYFWWRWLYDSHSSCSARMRREGSR